MPRRYNDELREDATRAVMDFHGFNYSGAGRLLDEAQRGNPRVKAWVKEADAILAVVFPRLARKA